MQDGGDVWDVLVPQMRVLHGEVVGWAAVEEMLISPIGYVLPAPSPAHARR